MTLKDKIAAQRPFILYCELLGLLHDIGKLSEGFCRIRLTWKGIKGGYHMDPHDDKFFDHKDGDKKLLRKL